jgi:phosphatidylinositol 4-kinase type 2
MSTRSLRSEYQPLVSQEDESDVADDHHASSSNPSAFHPRSRRALRPGSIDLTKLDNAFKRSALLNDPITFGNS